MVNRRQVKEYTKWLTQTLQKENLTTQDMVKILDGQLQLPERLVDGELIRKCRLALYPKIHGEDVPGKQETLERVHTFLQRDSHLKGEGENGFAGKKKHFRLRPAAFVASVLVIVLLFGVTINAVGFNVWRLIFQWNDETMEMEIAMRGRTRGYEDYLTKAYTDDFFRKLEEMDMTPQLPPKPPDGYVLEQVDGKIETDYMRWVIGSYKFGERQFAISVEKNTLDNSNGIRYVEKDERKPDIYERGGIKYYIIDNLSRSLAFWIDPPYIINISGHVTREELRQMIDSIYERSISQ